MREEVFGEVAVRCEERVDAAERVREVVVEVDGGARRDAAAAQRAAGAGGAAGRRPERRGHVGREAPGKAR